MKGLMTIKVFMDGGHRHGQNMFVHGKVLGYMEAICKTSDKRRGWRKIGDTIGVETTVWATENEYVELRNTVDKYYPGLCKFEIIDLGKEEM